MMRKFRVRTGKHCQDNTTYKVGDVVDSALDLIKLFPNKFVEVSKRAKVSEGTPVTAGQPAIPEPPEEKDTVEVPEGEESHDHSGASNEPPEDDEEEEDVDDEVAETKETPAADDEVKKPSVEEKKILIETYGKSVTNTYRTEADKAGVMVFKDEEKKYTVIDLKDLEPLTKERMTRVELRAFLKDLAKTAGS